MFYQVELAARGRIEEVDSMLEHEGHADVK